jgi:hypothetical protein
MHLIKRVFLILSFCLPALFAMSQPDSCHLRISLLTCSPGADLYSIWGHTGIRLTDSAKSVDVVFNYGTFDDSDPLFYAKFTRGIMMYSLSVWSFTDYMREYEYEHRSVTEQTLHLTCEEKSRLVAALAENAKESNRFYGYHFYEDNCTTRARDIIIKNTGAVAFKNILPPGHFTFRQLIHIYLDKGGQYWNKLGIDILLGSNLDKEVNNGQAMFLPDYLMKGLDSATLNGRSLVAEKNDILSASPKQESGGVQLTPLLVFTLLFLVVAVLSFNKARWANVFIRVFDIIFFLVLGLTGILLLTLWIVRVDAVCRNNFNILLALPTHAIIIFFLNRQAKWIKIYWQLTIALIVLLLVTWIWLPQQMNNGLLPLAAIVLLRSAMRLKKIKHE